MAEYSHGGPAPGYDGCTGRFRKAGIHFDQVAGRLGGWARPAAAGDGRHRPAVALSAATASQAPRSLRLTGWYVRLERHDPAAHRHRHYSLYFEPTLWHPAGALGARWGRVPGFGPHPGYTRTGAPQGLSPAQARVAAQKLIARKQRRGYQVVARGQLYVHTVPDR